MTRISQFVAAALTLPALAALALPSIVVLNHADPRPADTSLATAAATSAPPATRASARPAVGADVSFPQGSGPFPTHAAFGIVGLDWPNAGGANPYRTTGIDWALGSSAARQGDSSGLQYYILAAEPGSTVAANWPRSNRVTGGALVVNPYGRCTGKDSTACAFVYGWTLAQRDLRLPYTGVDHRWWLDVETSESWQPNTDAGHAANRAALEGMLAGLDAGNVRSVGIYSTRLQWSTIVGDAPGSSPLRSLPNWIPIGVGTTSAGTAACSGQPLMDGRIAMVQFVRGTVASGQDYDVRCD